MKSDYQHYDRAAWSVGLPMRLPADLPALRSRKKRALFQRDLPERLLRGEVKDGLLDRALQAQADGDNPHHQRDWEPKEHRLAHSDHEHLRSIEIPPPVEREGRRYQDLLRRRQCEGEGENSSEKRVRDLPPNRRPQRGPSPFRLLDAQPFLNHRWNGKCEGRPG